MKYKWYLTIIAVSLAALISSTTGCIKIVRQEPASTPEETPAPPIINSFTASPTSINEGQRTTLSWNVSGATKITIQPEIGTAGPTGSLQLSPTADITYTLTATNESGSATGSVTVTVMPVITGKPDLVITDFWLAGDVLNYTIKNQGIASAKPSWANLYVNSLKKAQDYVDILAAGEEKTSSFSNFPWLYPAQPEVISATIQTLNVKVCADGNNEIEEFDEDNNCIVKIWGMPFTYDFVKNAHLASWRNEAGELKWPMVSYDKKGAAYLLHNTIVMCPEQVSNGWIQGRFADFYVDKDTHAARSRPIEIPEMAKFTAEVGFGPNDTSSDGVRVALGYLDSAGSIVMFPKIDVYSDGTLRLYEIDLSDLAGMKTEFILRVEAKDSPEGDCVRWVEPKIVQAE